MSYNDGVISCDVSQLTPKDLLTTKKTSCIKALDNRSSSRNIKAAMVNSIDKDVGNYYNTIMLVINFIPLSLKHQTDSKPL